jgi:hypothetical protein
MTIAGRACVDAKLRERRVTARASALLTSWRRRRTNPGRSNRWRTSSTIRRPTSSDAREPNRHGHGRSGRDDRHGDRRHDVHRRDVHRRDVHRRDVHRRDVHRRDARRHDVRRHDDRRRVRRHHVRGPLRRPASRALRPPRR